MKICLTKNLGNFILPIDYSVDNLTNLRYFLFWPWNDNFAFTWILFGDVLLSFEKENTFWRIVTLVDINSIQFEV